MKADEVVKTEVLVIGGGIAGAAAAIFSPCRRG